MTNLLPQAQKLAKKYPTPFLLVDLDSIKQKYQLLKESFPGIEVHYAMKANPQLEVLKVLNKENAGFEITSTNELQQLLHLRITPDRIISLNPVKTPDFIQFAHQKGVDIFAFDSFDEVDKLAKLAPKSKVVLRITVDNTGSDWPLTRKFGVPASDALQYLQYAKKKNLVPYGLTFHVGSQCLNISNWANALYTCERVWHQTKKTRINLKMLSLGGGLPVQHTKKIPRLEEVQQAIQRVIENNFLDQDLHLSIEPGRAIVGDSAILVASVIGRAKRGSENWLYLDVGVFNGLMETIEKFRYEVKTDRVPTQGVYTLAGPSCDSVDIVAEDVPLPNLKIGDKVYFLNAGAYTLPYASNFNGFAPPRVYFL